MQPSMVEQPGIEDLPKDREAEQGDLDGPMECSITLGGVASQTRRAIREAQSRGELPWSTTEAVGRIAAERDYSDRVAHASVFSQASPAGRQSGSEDGTIQTCSWHDVQSSGAIFCAAPASLPRYCANSIKPTQRLGQSGMNSKLKLSCSPVLMKSWSMRRPGVWRRSVTWQLSRAASGGLILGVVTGPMDVPEEHMRQKALVSSSMHEKARVYQDAQTKHVISRQCSGINKVNHIRRVSGEDIFQSGRVLQIFDDVSRCHMDRLLPGLTEEGHAQAALCAAVGV